MLKKLAAWKFILHIHECLCKAFGVHETNHIHKVWEVTAVVYTLHVRHRQRFSKGGSFITKTDKLKSLQAAGVALSIESLDSAFMEHLALYNLQYGDAEAGRKNAGTVSAILTWLSLSKARFNEVKFGNTRIVQKKYGQRFSESGDALPAEDDIDIVTLGYTPAHQVFFGGSTFNPTMQSSIKQGLGPLLILYNLGKQTEAKYRKSWEEIAMAVFGLIPGHEHFLRAIIQHGNKCTTLNRAIGDLCMLGVTRSNNKATLPMAMVLSVARKNAAYAQKFGSSYDGTILTAILDEHITASIRDIDLSGKGLARFYFEASSMKYTMYKKGEGCEKFYPQILFHSIFGTNRDDAAIFEHMTGERMLLRGAMGKEISGPVDKTKPISIIPLPLLYGTKLASASQTGLLRGGQGQVCPMPVVSGRVSHRVSELGDLFKHLNESGGITHVPTSADVGHLVGEINALTKGLLRKIEKAGEITRGTKPFYKINNVAGSFQEGEEQTVPINAKGVYFYGKDDEY